MRTYWDTLFEVRSRGDVHNTFAAAHLDLFLTADVDRLSFLSEVFFEAEDNEFVVDIERLQAAYLVSNWLRIRAGRTHTAFGYYNDTYHHGNLFELTTGRPYAVQFEDEGGLFVAHLVGLGIDGTLDAGGAGSFRYDLEVGNGRLSDISAVAVEQAGKDAKLVNLRLRWMPIDGLIIGVNALHDEIPALVPTPASAAARPKVDEQIGGAHIAYMEHGVHFLLESYLIRHAPTAGPVAVTSGGFLELGYAVGQFTPYIRPELIHFPGSGDPVFQADISPYAGTRNLTDVRVGIRWQPLPQVAIKLEGDRLAHDANHEERATVKAAFGF